MEHNHNDQHHTHHSAVSKLKGHAGAIETWLVPILSKLPHLPSGGKKFVTDIAPWLSIIVGILGLIGLLGAGMIAVLLSPLVALSKGFLGIILFITIALGLTGSIFSILAFKPLRVMKKEGWDYAFYALFISLISAVLSMMAMFGGLGDLIGVVIGIYIIFEVRGRYL